MCQAEYYKQNWDKGVSSLRIFCTFCVRSYVTMIAVLCEVRAMVQEYMNIDIVLKQLKRIFSVKYEFCWNWEETDRRRALKAMTNITHHNIKLQAFNFSNSFRMITRYAVKNVINIGTREWVRGW